MWGQTEMDCQCATWFARNVRWATLGEQPEAMVLAWHCPEHGIVKPDADGVWACAVPVAVVTVATEEPAQLALFGAAA